MLTAFAPFVFFDFLPFPKFAFRLRWMMELAGNMVQRYSGNKSENELQMSLHQVPERRESVRNVVDMIRKQGLSCPFALI